jgi:hypothetical protein
MAHDSDPITATYEGFTVIYDGRGIAACHEQVDALHRQAQGLAPRFADDTADSGCTNYGDLKGAGPRQLKAYALIAQAHAWNEIAGILEQARDARNAPRTDDRGVRYVEAGAPAPRSFADPVTCGTCGRTWDDKVPTGVTPAPAARCPFEYDHEDLVDDEPVHPWQAQVNVVHGTPRLVTDAQLQAAFLAARRHGVILQDDVLRAIIAAAQEVRP